jgi:ketosteroid isomerase-like protein
VTSANLDIVRSIYADWEHGDYTRTEWAHPEIDFEVADGPAPGSASGVDEMAERFQSILAAWDDWRSAAEEYRELDDERILVFVRRSGRGRVSGLDLSKMRNQGAAIYHFRGGKVTKIVLYFDRERALSDLGLD